MKRQRVTGLEIKTIFFIDQGRSWGAENRRAGQEMGHRQQEFEGSEFTGGLALKRAVEELCWVNSDPMMCSFILFSSSWSHSYETNACDCGSCPAVVEDCLPLCGGKACANLPECSLVPFPLPVHFVPWLPTPFPTTRLS